MIKLGKSPITTYLSQIPHFPLFGTALIPPSLFLQCLCTRTGTRAENPRPQCIMFCKSIGIEKNIKKQMAYHQVSNMKHPWFKTSSNILAPSLPIPSEIPPCPAPEGSEQCLEDAYNLSLQSLFCTTLYLLVI